MLWELGGARGKRLVGVFRADALVVHRGGRVDVARMGLQGSGLFALLTHVNLGPVARGGDA